MVMTKSECQIIRDLIPLYADGVASEASLRLVEGHLAGCDQCRELLEECRRPAFPQWDTSKNTLYPGAERFRGGLRRVAVVFMTGIIVLSSTIAWASYYAGRNMALRDPSFRQAEKMGLFTEVDRVEKYGPYQITVDRVLLDSARTTVIYRIQPELGNEDNLDLDMIDDKGVRYDPRGGRGIQGKYFIYDLEPVNLDAKKIILSFSNEQIPGEAKFEIPVDPTLVAQNTREIYPDLKVTSGPVDLAVDRAILGLTESIVSFRVRWPRDASIAGVGIGLDRPMYSTMGPNGPTSAESRVSRVPPESMIKDAGAFPPGFWADMVDETNGKRIKLKETSTRTDTVTGGIKGSFHFEPVEPSARELKLDFPPLFLYRFPETEQVMELSCPREGKLALSGSLHGGPVVFNLQQTEVAPPFLSLFFKFIVHLTSSVVSLWLPVNLKPML